jgi:hypothetical protein
MKNRDTSIAELCSELGVTKPTLYRNVTPIGELTEAGRRVLEGKSERKAKAKPERHRGAWATWGDGIGSASAFRPLPVISPKRSMFSVL